MSSSWRPGQYKLLNQLGDDIYLHDRSAIIGYGLLAICIDHQEVSTVRSQCALDCGLNCEAGIDI